MGERDLSYSISWFTSSVNSVVGSLGSRPALSCQQGAMKDVAGLDSWEILLLGLGMACLCFPGFFSWACLVCIQISSRYQSCWMRTHSKNIFFIFTLKAFYPNAARNWRLGLPHVNLWAEGWDMKTSHNNEQAAFVLFLLEEVGTKPLFYGKR